jgi:hypothetical protein
VLFAGVGEQRGDGKQEGGKFGLHQFWGGSAQPSDLRALRNAKSRTYAFDVTSLCWKVGDG